MSCYHYKGGNPQTRAIGHTRGILTASPWGQYSHHANGLQPYRTMLLSCTLRTILAKRVLT